LIKTTAYLFLATLAVLQTYTPCIANDYEEAHKYQGLNTSNLYEDNQKAYREMRERRHRAAEYEADERRRRAEEAAQADDHKFRDEDADKGSQVVSDDVPFKKRKSAVDDYSGSQFNAPDFSGTDFQKSSFDDLDRDMRKFDSSNGADHLYIVDEMDMPGRSLERAREKARKEFDDISHRDRVMPGADWAPSNLDPLDNGGFTTADDNGAPVPYKLNGHVDWQRRPAWEAAD
jgi:hypothetical protein